VEFALIAPFAFLILLGLVVLGIVVLHEIQLSQAVRDSARAAAICGSRTGATSNAPTLPDSNLSCNNANLVAYINARLSKVDPSLANAATVSVYSDTNALVASNTGANAGATAANCSATVVKSANGVVIGAYTVEVSVNYAQPLYLPLVGAVFGTGGGNTRTISAKGEATCEQ
jgi:Flp pilus assembly protein TadG